MTLPSTLLLHGEEVSFELEFIGKSSLKSSLYAYFC